MAIEYQEFDTWEEAFSAARKFNRPIIAVVNDTMVSGDIITGGIARVFPSGRIDRLSEKQEAWIKDLQEEREMQEEIDRQFWKD